MSWAAAVLRPSPFIHPNLFGTATGNSSTVSSVIKALPMMTMVCMVTVVYRYLYSSGSSQDS